MNEFQIFIKFILPPIILFLGLIGNSIGFVVLLNKKLRKLGPLIIYKYLLLIDSLYLIQIVVTYFELTFGYSLTLISVFSCKLWFFLNYSLAVISPLLLVYISIEKCISIKSPSYRFILRRKDIQISYILITIIYNLLFDIPVALYIVIKNDTNQTICSFDNTEHQNLISLMDLINRVVIPFTIMVFCSLILTISIFRSRARIVRIFLPEEKKRFSKEIKIAISSICMNLFYIFANLPISIVVFFNNFFNNDLYGFYYYLFYSGYAINFYILVATNSIFRKEFLNILSYK